MLSVQCSNPALVLYCIKKARADAWAFCMGLPVLADAIQGDPALADFADVDGLGLAGLFAGANLVLNTIALIEGLEAVHLDSAKVNKNIGFRAVLLGLVGSDETIALLAEERFFKRTGCHE